MYLQHFAQRAMLATNFDPNELNAFFTRLEIWDKNRLHDFQGAFHKLFPDLNMLRSTRAATQRNEAPNFNIFRALRWDSSEVRTHSAFLANLLDPNGSHGQGELFLDKFLQLCGGKHSLLKSIQSNLKVPLSSFDWIIKIEKPVVTEAEDGPKPGRLDIALMCRKAKTLIVIENKIHAKEGVEQLGRYKKWMAKQRSSFPNQLLIYLTLEGDESTTKQQDLRLSYREDIEKLLSDSPNAIARNVQEIIWQYRQLIRFLTNQDKSMNTKYEHELADWLLADKANVHVAFEIANVFLLLKQKALRKFWNQVRSRIEKALNQNGHTDWQVSPEKGNPFDNWFGIVLSRSKKEGGSDAFHIKVEQDLPKDFSFGPFNLDYGVYCERELSGENIKRLERIPEYQNLLRVLMDSECTQKSAWWPGYKRNEMDSLDQFLEKFIEEEAGTVNGVVDELWNLFLEIHPFVTNVNQAIGKVS